MKKTILTIALAVAFAIPFAGSADAYGERWYMVKDSETAAVFGSPNDRYQIGFCRMSKGDRVERLNTERRYGSYDRWFIYGRKLGGPIWCKGWVPLPTVYNMDTVVQDLNDYRNLGNTVPVWQHSSAIWVSRNKARSAPSWPRRMQYFVKHDNTSVYRWEHTVCTVNKGTRVNPDNWNGRVAYAYKLDLTVADGPQKGCRGYLSSRKIEQIESHARWDHHAPKVCDITVGTKVHVFEDQFNGAARIKVIDGPCRNREGWILSYTLKR